MAENFDYKKYSDLLNDFTNKIIFVYQEWDGRIAEILAPLCEFLNIGKVDAIFYENPEEEQKVPLKTIVFYDSGDYDVNQAFFYREFIGNGNVIHYRFYPAKGQKEYDGEAKGRIDALERLFNVYIERCRLKGVIEYFMTHDVMMNMYNLNYLLQTVDRHIKAGIINKFCMCQFNLKQFALINEIVGRGPGTGLMIQYTQRIQSLFTSDEEVVARVGGDNFAVLLYKEHLDALIEIFRGVTFTANTLTHTEIVISASAGVYVLPPYVEYVRSKESGSREINSTDLMDRVSIACKVARNDRRTSVAYFDDQMLYIENNAKLVQSMFPAALENGEFNVYYQPKVNLDDFSLIGAEALCRWYHEGGLITPDKFIPIFERKGLIAVLDFFMLEHVCKDIRKWIDGGEQVVPISVNLSRCHFEDKKLFEHIMEIIDKYGIPHEYIEIELTETATDVDFTDLKNIVLKLKEQGICTTVDDFGIGYSSLNLIRELPWDVIKLDKSFLKMDENARQSRSMLKHVVEMATELGVSCIAEGVETQEDIDLIKDSKCFMAQGYYFDKPLPIRDFEDRLKKHRYVEAVRC